jgi:hypothetical protein
MTSRTLLYYWQAIPLLLVPFCTLQAPPAAGPVAPAFVKIIFFNNVKGDSIVLNDVNYVNSFGEKYTISKLRYYVSHIALRDGSHRYEEKDSYHLIDESNHESRLIGLGVLPGEYQQLQFLVGVDSLHNVSGAQTDDLDPAKDMFWTWNSGYVMAKMEGQSPASNRVNHSFEFHIGGFSGPFNVLKEIQLNLPENVRHLAAGKSYEIVIGADVNQWWQGSHDLRLSQNPVITTPGANAKKISDNYANMFRILKVIAE